MNMYKVNIALLVITFSFINIFAQKIEPGKYESVSKYDHFSGETMYNMKFGEEITFLDSINILYRYRDVITDNRGSGYFTLGKDFLNLEISGNQTDFDTTNYKIVDSSFSKSDSI